MLLWTRTEEFLCSYKYSGAMHSKPVVPNFFYTVDQHRSRTGRTKPAASLSGLSCHPALILHMTAGRGSHSPRQTAGGPSGGLVLWPSSQSLTVQYRAVARWLGTSALNHMKKTKLWKLLLQVLKLSFSLHLISQKCAKLLPYVERWPFSTTYSEGSSPSPTLHLRDILRSIW